MLIDSVNSIALRLLSVESYRITSCVHYVPCLGKVNTASAKCESDKGGRTLCVCVCVGRNMFTPQIHLCV